MFFKTQTITETLSHFFGEYIDQQAITKSSTCLSPKKINTNTKISMLFTIHKKPNKTL